MFPHFMNSIFDTKYIDRFAPRQKRLLRKFIFISEVQTTGEQFHESK